MAGTQPIRFAERPRAVAAAFLIAAAIAFALLAVPDTMGDLGEYCRWTRRLVAHGLEGAYFPAAPTAPAAGGDADLTAAIDYPPALPYLLWLAGHVANWVADGAAGQDRLLGVVIRVPFVLAHLALGGVLFAYVARESGRRTAWLVLVAHLFNPAILFDTCYWGQADSLLALLLVATIVAATRGRLAWAWGLLVLAALLKPLAYPYFALLVVFTVKQGGWRRLVRCGAIAGLTSIVALAPFLWIGRFLDIVSAVVHQVDSMPFASANAHNLWWLLTGGLPWTPANEPFLLGLSCEHTGFLLFGAFLASTMVWLWRADAADALPLAAAGTALGFFVLSTHLHENHLFVFLPLLSLAAFRRRGRQWIYWVATATVLVNMVAHDPYLRFVVGPHLPGPRLTLPSAKWVVDPTLTAYFLQHGYAHVVEVERGLTTWCRMAVTFAGSEANVLLLIAWLLLQWRGIRSAREETGRRWGGRWWLAATGVVALTAVPFFARERQFARRQYFLAHLNDARVGDGEPEARWGAFPVDGRPRWIILARPPSELRYSLQVPTAARLALSVALDPNRQWPADAKATRFEVDLIAPGRRDTIFTTSIDPQMPHSTTTVLDLSGYAGQGVEIVFRTTNGGPAVPHDAAGWVEPGFL